MKLNLKNPTTWDWPRQEWGSVINLLKPYQSDDGIVVDGFIDATFGYWYHQSISNNIIPYKKEWVGFWHHPPNISPWLDHSQLAPEVIIQNKAFRASLPNCKGIFTFSSYLTRYLQKYLDVPVESLVHPTPPSDVTFDFYQFKESKQIVQIGSWLRRLSSFYLFDAPGYQKIHLTGLGALKNLKKELEYNYNKNICQDNVQMLSFVEDSEYNNLLSRSIVFLDLYDSSVNNTIIQCIVRNTPIVVNKIEPVIEYLGEDYPLYYRNISDIPDLIKDDSIIYAAFEYIEKLPIKRKLTDAYFVDSMINSQILSSVYEQRQSIV